MIEYAKGPVTSEWGAVRARDGHPEPYPLKYIQISNEVGSSARRLKEYFEKFKGLATEIWKADPEMSVYVGFAYGSVSLHVQKNGMEIRASRSYPLRDKVSQEINWSYTFEDALNECHTEIMDKRAADIPRPKTLTHEIVGA